MSDNDEYSKIFHQMEKFLAEESKKVYKEVGKQLDTMKIKIHKPIIYGPPATIGLGRACDYDRGAWRSKVYHVVFEGRGTAHTLCGRETLRRELWVAYLQPGEEEETPIARRVCKKCAAHEDYALYLLAKT